MSASAGLDAMAKRKITAAAENRAVIIQPAT
jgi:hypothetical protein